MMLVVDMSSTTPSTTTVAMAFTPTAAPPSKIAPISPMSTLSNRRNRFCALSVKAECFNRHHRSIPSLSSSPRRSKDVIVLAAGRGFGNQNSSSSSSSSSNSNNKKDGSSQHRKSYDKDALRPVQGLLDMESAMGEFFSSREDWHPLFRSLAVDTTVPAMTLLEKTLVVGDGDDDGFEFHESTSPWRRLQAIPTGDDEREVLANFLDAMQQSLVDIPVDETTKDDENDLHFVEEGRRMLVCSRFHVIQNMDQRTVDSYDSLFHACWNEIAELSMTDEIDTGSLIVVPDLDYEELRQFADMNLQRPLQWLGMNDIFEVASLERGGLGVVRLIHKLSEIPIPEEASDEN